MSILTDEQERFYAEQGYLLVTGLIPAEIAREAEAAMRRLIETADGSGGHAGHQVFEEPALLACYTRPMLAAAARLAGDDPATIRPPSRAYAINVFPQEGEWQWPAPHIDHAIQEHGHKTFPRAFRIAAMTFLSDVASHGGGTIVWPGSAQKLLRLAETDPAQYETMWALNQDLSKADLGAPKELTPRQGDVLFYHCLCAHAGSQNVSDRPRLALNTKW